MIRAPWGDQAYWQNRVEKFQCTISEINETLPHPSKNPVYRPQYVWGLSKDYFRLILLRYSRGDPIQELGSHFGGLLDAWELSNRLSEAICKAHSLKTCRDWRFELANLNHYNWCFWLVGLALALDIPDDQWQRLLHLIVGEGQDNLLDRVIASRTPSRQIGDALLHKKPYAHLLRAVDAPKNEQASLLREFVDNWYLELARNGKDGLWWYIYGDPVKHPLDMGSYFGRWCLEAVAAVKAFNLDDSQCLGREHYPGDLLRPSGPGTHPVRQEPARGFMAKLFGRK